MTSLLLLVLPIATLAQTEIPKSPIVTATLIIDAPSIKKDVPIIASVAFTLPKGWHIYAKDPGDAGIPTSLEWTLPEGLKAGEILWPPHERFESQGIVNYGYSDHVTLPSNLTPSRDGITGMVKVKASWLACADICIPESVELNAPLSAEGVTPSPHHSPRTTHDSLFTYLALAFLGGLILNLMPCVLPILALKALALVKKAEASRKAAAQQSIAYSAGVVGSFLVIAGLMLALKATGSAVGWGFQLQNPVFVAFLAIVMALVAANLLGLFEVPVLFGEKATGIDDSKLSGSFLTGALAVLVATPCTAPFMATAIGATLALPTISSLLVFAALGLGLAFPFLLISLWPAARRLIPKPGRWMNRIKHLLAIPMLATTVWLLFVLYQLLQPMPTISREGYEIYSPAKLEQLRTQGKPVLVDATAAWCLTCKVNERVAFAPMEMQQLFREKGITLMVADWTARDEAITNYLAGFGRNGVPLYVYYPAHAEPKILPQILTPAIVREAIESNE